MIAAGRSLLLVALGVAGGAAGMALVRPSAAPMTTREIREVERAAPAPVVRCVATLADDQLRVLREDIARLAPAAAAEGHEAAAAPPPSPQSEAAGASATQIVATAIARGTWTDDDLAAFRHELPLLGPSQLQEVMSRLVVAINEGRLRPVTTGPFLGF
jgi:hypothetical protein